MLDVWAHSDGPAAARWIAESGANDEINAYEVLISGWAEADPRAAGEFALSMRDHASFGSFPLHIVDAWVHQDFAGAAEWVGDIEDTELRHQFQQLLIERSRNYVDREPALAYALANLEDNTALLDAVMTINRELADRDPAAALAWGRSNLENPRHAALYERSILSHLARHHPEAASGLLADFPADHPDAAAVHASAARSWAGRDPAAALAWAGSLAPGEIRDGALLGLAEGWMADDHTRAAAAEWVATFPPGPFRDQLSDRHARALMDTKDIQHSIDVAASISDPFLRDETFEDILKVWYRDEIKAEAARAFIESTDLITDTVRWRILNRKDGHP